MWKEMTTFHLMPNIQKDVQKKKKAQQKAVGLTLLGKYYSDAIMKWEQQVCNYDHILFVTNKGWWKMGAEQHQKQGCGGGGFKQQWVNRISRREGVKSQVIRRKGEGNKKKHKP